MESTINPRERELPAVANASLLLACIVGAALLLWWTLEFHRDNRQLWMVPVGLILMGTPAVVWFSVVASDAWRRIELLLLADPEVLDKETHVQDLEK